MERKYQEYIEKVISKINTDYRTKEKIRQSLAEHIDAVIEKHGSLAYNKLDSAEKVAGEFSENLDLNKNSSTEYNHNYPVWKNRSPYSKISDKKIFNMPLYHVTDGYNPKTGEFEIAKGFFAFGPVAFGVFSIGAVSFGLFSLGAVSVGLLIALGAAALGGLGAFGGLAVGGLLAIGGLAISYGLSIGGMAVGHIAIGDKTIGEFIHNSNTGEGNAVDWFRDNLPYFVKYFN